MEAHHNEVEPQTVEAVHRPGRRRPLGRPPRRARRVARAVRQAPARRSSRSRRATRASTRSTRCRPAARSASWSQPARSRRRRRRAALARDRARDRAGARVPGPDQGHRDPGVASRRTTLASGEAFHVTTFGCQMNEHDSERMKGMLESIGYAEAPTREDADLILFNTCSIREKADDRFVSAPARGRGAQAPRPGARDRRRRLLGAVGQGRRVPPVPVRRRRVRARAGPQAGGVPHQSTRSPHRASSSSRASPATCRPSAPATSRAGCRSRPAATWSARTASCPRRGAARSRGRWTSSSPRCAGWPPTACAR